MSKRGFGQHTPAELEYARKVATEIVEKYGYFENEALWKQFREHGIWNDHEAVQVALRVIIDLNDAKKEEPLTASRLADALGCFWNAAFCSARESQDSTTVATISAMAEGIAAIQNRLLES